MLAIVAIALCVKALVDHWSDSSDALRNAHPGWLTLALVLSALSMATLAALWRSCLAAFGRAVRLRDALAWYFGGELGKYVPGGIWPVLGRGELAFRAGVPRAAGYLTTLVSYVAMCGAAVTSCGFLVPLAVLRDEAPGWAAVFVVLVPLGLLPATPAALGLLLRAGAKLTKGRLSDTPPPGRTMMLVIVTAIPAWLFVGGAAVAVTHALGFEQQPERIAAAAVCAWIAGFAVVPVPSGAGVRELVFAGVCGLAAGPAVTVAAIARLLFVVVDGVGGLAGLWFSRRRHGVAADRPPAGIRAGDHP